ncbi:MAG: class I SAM-dependent methyltransferase [Roseburia sp.]|nr:class I SAM-dependent methyltransferase [Roseburia sp.]
MGRIEELCALIDCCGSFADVGCDHGYCALSVLKSGKCKNVLVTDVSAKCLSKAEKLLAQYFADGTCSSACCDGLALVPESVEQALIAGMGGEEIIKILTEGFIPLKFVLQPMKNAPKLRKFLIGRGCKITYDGIFKDGKFYFVIKGERFGGSYNYSPAELEFGRDSIKSPAFNEYAAAEREKDIIRLSKCVDGAQREKILKRLALFNEVLS